MATPFSLDIGDRRLTGLDWGGTGPDLLFLHPNGFCAGLFDPIASRLSPAFRCLGIDLAGHGGSDPPADLEAFTLSDLAADVLTVLDHLGVGEVRLVGHSLGGVVSVLVDQQRPGLVSAMLLCEAVIIPPPDVFTRPTDRPPMAEIARKRRVVWPDREAMRARFASQPPMAELAPEALDAYLRWGTVDQPDGQVALACPPEVEAAVFDLTPTERGSLPAWEHLPRLQGRAVVLSGAQSTVDGIFTYQAERIGCLHVVVPGGHFQLEEDTDRGADLVTRHLGGLLVG